ncbi:MAG: DUF975 family protein [Eubacteriales bacterium]|nr:DUF975 family protein [Eubacteriales bacterium]
MMGTYRELKRAAKKSFKRHYWLYVAACLIAAFIGSEFVLSLNAIKTDFSLPENEIFGRTGGVFAKIVNGVTSGTIVGALKSGVLQIVGKQSVVDNIFVVSSMVAYIFMWLFIQNVYKVSMRRIFLEGRIYSEIRYQRFLYIIRVKKWIRTAWNMLVLSVFQLMWLFTVIGPVIIRYSYYLVPYILAENPEISARRAMILSKKMMNGHKWRCFLFELSFLGWDILGLATGGIAAVLFVNPYKIAAFSEVYAQLRTKAIEKHVVFSEYLKDEYLFNICDAYKLNGAYADIIRLEEHSLSDSNDEIYGIKGKIVDFLGISILSYEKEKEYEAVQVHRIRIDLYKSIIAGNEYPDRLSIFPEKEKRQMGETLHYMRHYSIWSIVLLFFTFAVIGWTWEVLLHIVQYGSYVNRGMLHGPWLPIYGAGGVMILTVLSRFRKKPLQEFIWAIVLCGVVEYATSYVSELIHGIRWWDYQGFFLNINGRICAEGLLVFGIGGIVIVYVVAPLLDNQFRKIRHRIIVPLCIGLIIIFAADMVYSSKVPNTGAGITSQAETSGQVSVAIRN